MLLIEAVRDPLEVEDEEWVIDEDEEDEVDKNEDGENDERGMMSRLLNSSVWYTVMLTG